MSAPNRKTPILIHFKHLGVRVTCQIVQNKVHPQ